MSFSDCNSIESFEGISHYIQNSIIYPEYDLNEDANEISNSDVIIANLSDDEIVEESANCEKTEILSKLQKVFKKKYIKKERKIKFQNECRYIIGNAIQAMNSYDLPDDFKQFYRRIASSITGYQVLRQHLIILEEDKEDVGLRKKQFQSYLLKFLQQKGTPSLKQATLFILKSKKKQNLRDYLQYKNQILMFYIRYPEMWNGNQLPHFDEQQHTQQ